MKIVLLRSNGDSVNNQLPQDLDELQGMAPPLGLAYLASALRYAGNTISIIDSLALNLSADQLSLKIKEESPDLVGITIMTPGLINALRDAKICKKHNAKVVVGGPQLSLFPQETVSHDAIDFGIIGEGEHSLVELVKSLENHLPIKNIKGLIYKENNNVFVNDPDIIEDIDSILPPSRDLLPMDRYSSIASIGKMATMITSRGCPCRCGFCTNPPFMKIHRTRNPKNVVDEMENVIKEYGIQEIMFYDDTLTLKKPHIEGICNEIISRGIKVAWSSPTRSDTLDRNLLKLMAEAGCVHLRMGVESANPDILKLMRKEINLEHTWQVFKWAREFGIKTFAFFIIGYATETPDTIKETISFACKLSPDGVVFSVATPYPGTHLFELACQQNLVDKNYWREYSLGKRQDRLPYFVKDAEEWEKTAYKKFYLRPRYILGKLKELRNWDIFKKYFSIGFKLLSMEGIK